MAVLIRTSDTAIFVHTGDPATVLPDPMPEVWPGPEQNWLSATGQPQSATRFEIRPLAPSEYARVQALYRDGDDIGARAALCAGLVSVDGNPPDMSGFAFGWDVEIANLVSGVTLRPLAGRRLRSTAPE